MHKYSVLLVDDEELVFQVMMKKLNWEEMGFSVDGYARNGVEALEKAEEQLPDVVMTDIKMPYMDGLTLCRRLKELYPDIKVIIFSGFDEFEYAKEAIKIEAEEYILKPIDAEELKGVFQRIRNTLDKEIDEKRNIDKLQEHYNNSLPILQDNFYISLIEGRMSPGSIDKCAYDYQIDLEGPYFVATVVHISYHTLDGKEVDIAPFLLSVSVEKLLEERLHNVYKYKLISYMGDIIAIIQLRNEKDVYSLTDRLDAICKIAKRKCNAIITAGVGYVCSSPASIKDSYASACNAVDYRSVYGNMRALNIAEIDSQRADADDSWYDETIMKIVGSIKISDAQKLNEAIYDLCRKLEESHISIQNYQIIIMKLLVEMYSIVANNQLNLSEITGTDENITDLVKGAESPEDMEQKLTTLGLGILQALVDKRASVGRSFIAKAEEYIHMNYSDPNISVNSLCSILGISSAYFSSMFKKSTGKTFINYLTDVRMEHAIELLDSSDEKTYTIAEKIGYMDPNYFSYVFKKQYGVSPSKYRSNKQE